MKLNANQLGGQLDGPLQAVYLIAGDETLLVQEAADQVRRAARAQGFDEREVHPVEARYDWSGLALATGTLSLFASKRLLELRLSRPPGMEAGKALTIAAESATDDTVILVTSPRLESKSTRTAWYRKLEKAAVLVPIYAIDEEKLPAWVRQRMIARGLQPDAAAVAVLVERSEGNLLACVQDIEKLLLLYGDAANNGVIAIGAEAVVDAVADNARFDIFALGEAALQGRSGRVTRILGALRAEGIAAPLVLWSLSREIRTLALMGDEMQRGRSMNQVIGERKYQVWPKRRPMVQGALQRLGPRRCRQLLLAAMRIDGMIKGTDSVAFAGNRRNTQAENTMVWNALLALGTGLAAKGRPPVSF